MKPTQIYKEPKYSISSGFRIARDTTTTVPLFEFETREKQGSSNYSFFSKPTQQQQHTSYSDQVYINYLRLDSTISYISHRHQVDTRHGLAEKERLALWFGLAQRTWSNTRRIKQHKHDAIDKLSMIRNHLVHKANGDFELVAIDDNTLKLFSAYAKLLHKVSNIFSVSLIDFGLD
ncbi:hypothetical protein EDC94DRAFT_579759 [Helicostylum pulchrum]|nr:hypothetical protein EDC94DRAFT_579759 [Helicostylum pulchrum]